MMRERNATIRSPSWHKRGGLGRRHQLAVAHVRAPRRHHHLEDGDQQRQHQREMTDLDDQRRALRFRRSSYLFAFRSDANVAAMRLLLRLQQRLSSSNQDLKHLRVGH